MESHAYDYKRFAILYVDDEERSLKYFARAFEHQFRILTAPNAQEGLRLLEAHGEEIGLLMTDQRMPGEKGVWLLERARQLQPRIIRLLATAYADMDAAIAAVNTGAIYKYVTKPWDPAQLETTLLRGLEFFMVQRERDDLMREKMSMLRHAMIADRIVSLGLMAAGLSHHIRNSLVAVKTFMDLAPARLREERVDLQALRNPEFWRDYYHTAQGQIARVNDLLKDLWQASERPGPGFQDEVRLCDLVGQVILEAKPRLAARNLSVENQIPASLPPLRVDGPKFRRLFELLVHDEIATLPAGATFTFSARVRDIPGTDEQEILLHLRDNGPGLPAETLRVIFDPFNLRADTPAEYGINLMAVFFIVHHHGGRIDARSEDGAGTTFSLTLPTDPERSPSGEENTRFLERVVLNDRLWERVLSSQ
ncbi:MAG: hypothetical protein RJA22_3011 [Verrucomicrobiota bacterium]|jgi:two-component system probable response regulator PhcQ